MSATLRSTTSATTSAVPLILPSRTDAIAWPFSSVLALISDDEIPAGMGDPGAAVGTADDTKADLNVNGGSAVEPDGGNQRLVDEGLDGIAARSAAERDGIDGIGRGRGLLTTGTGGSEKEGQADQAIAQASSGSGVGVVQLWGVMER